MTPEEAYEILDKKIDDFINNDFKHLRARVNWMFVTLVGGLMTIITGLILIICK
jgi:hypothetical protein